MALGKYKILITPENPEGLKVDYTPEEQAQVEADVERANTERTEYLAKIEQEKNDAKTGNQKFLDMGLTQAEATALTGYVPPKEESE